MHKTAQRRLAHLALPAAMGLSLLAGCASPEQTQRFQDGWKPGYVKAVGTASELGEQHPKLDCRLATDGDAAHDAFAVVSYPHGRRRLAVIAAVPNDFHPAPTEEVWVNSHHCEPLEPRSHGG